LLDVYLHAIEGGAPMAPGQDVGQDDDED